MCLIIKFIEKQIGKAGGDKWRSMSDDVSNSVLELKLHTLIGYNVQLHITITILQIIEAISANNIIVIMWINIG